MACPVPAADPSARDSRVPDSQLIDTICALATPPGGALAVVRLSGPKALDIVNKLFSRDLTEAKGGTLWHGDIVELGTKETVDEVVVSVFRAPHSYTGEDCVELSCHGSPYIMRRISQLLIDNGARLARPGEYTQRAFSNGKMDLSQAEAVADVISSETRAAHRMAMSQLRGSFSRELATLRARLLRLTTLLELELDFADQDVEFADRGELTALTLEAEARVESLVASFRTGNALKKGVAVAIVGAPNVGKSTLLNALVGDDRAIVSPHEGTTRDTVEDVVIIDGVAFRFIDTAGLRHTQEAVELMGIERSRKAAAQADVILMMSEPGVSEPDIEPQAGQEVIHIENKTPSFQAKTGVGLEDLRRRLLALVPCPREGEAVVSNVRHHEALTLALADLRRLRHSLSAGLPADLVSIDLRQCLHHLGEITGEITSDEVLANIFSHFCIGK